MSLPGVELRFVCWLAVAATSWLLAPTALAAESPPPPRTYAQAREFLSAHTTVIDLAAGDGGGRILVCPQWQGRIMTSTLDGDRGASLGWINDAFITAGKHSPAFNNYGGEDRFWLGPEGGQYGLFFVIGANQVVSNWFTPPALNTGAFRVDAQDAASCRVSRRVVVTNVAETSFDLDVSRELKLLPRDRLAALLGRAAAAAVADGHLKMVGFESANRTTNVGSTWKRPAGLVAIWTLGQFPAGEQVVIIVPYRAGSDERLGPVVNADYFGQIPADRLQVTPAAILFRGDGKFRSKLGTSPRRARPVAGSIDFQNRVLTIVQFTLADDPASRLYVNNTWKIAQSEPFAGDVFNSYNDGPAAPGAEALGSFYELETLSPTEPLAKGQSLTHTHRTFHFHGELPALAKLAKEILGVDLEAAQRMVAR